MLTKEQYDVLMAWPNGTCLGQSMDNKEEWCNYADFQYGSIDGKFCINNKVMNQLRRKRLVSIRNGLIFKFIKTAMKIESNCTLEIKQYQGFNNAD